MITVLSRLPPPHHITLLGYSECEWTRLTSLGTAATGMRFDFNSAGVGLLIKVMKVTVT